MRQPGFRQVSSTAWHGSRASAGDYAALTPDHTVYQKASTASAMDETSGYATPLP